jgi:predicted secreted protein
MVAFTTFFAAVPLAVRRGAGDFNLHYGVSKNFPCTSTACFQVLFVDKFMAVLVQGTFE